MTANVIPLRGAAVSTLHHQLVDCLTQPAVLVHRDGTLVHANAAWIRETGCPEQLQTVILSTSDRHGSLELGSEPVEARLAVELATAAAWLCL